MRRPPFCLGVLPALVLLWAAPARADSITIHIVSGSSAPEETIGIGSFELFGTGGFSFIGGFGFSNLGPPCCVLPGETQTIAQSAIGGDIGGTVKYAGDTYTHIGNATSTNQAGLSFVSNSFVVPSAGRPFETITVIEPFTLTGFFHGRPGDGDELDGGGPATLLATLTGEGLARVSLTWSGEGFWEAGLPHFDFTSPAPTPEPASLMLVGLGAAGLWTFRRRKQQAAAE
jgi:hypothetical protein